MEEEEEEEEEEEQGQEQEQEQEQRSTRPQFHSYYVTRVQGSQPVGEAAPLLVCSSLCMVRRVQEAEDRPRGMCDGETEGRESEREGGNEPGFQPPSPNLRSRFTSISLQGLSLSLCALSLSLSESLSGQGTSVC